MEAIKVPAIFQSFKSLKDGTIKCSFDLNECDPTALIANHNKFGWLIFAPEGVDQVEIPAEPPREFVTDKTPSQRLRGVMYIHYKAVHGSDEGFNTYYHKQIEKWIEHFKELLNEMEA